MSGLTIGWEYLTGYAVATDSSSRDRAEWPPHPGRLFMALAAAWFETGEDDEEGRALRRMESLGDPELYLPADVEIAERTNVTFYVPVNDKAGPSKSSLQSVSGLLRSKQPRTFPRVYVGDQPCWMHWAETDISSEELQALDRLCAKVTRLGHSSSLVRMWVAEMPPVDSSSERLVSEERLPDQALRSISPGMLQMLADRYGEAPRQQHALLSEKLGMLKAAKKSIKGSGSKERKAAIDVEIQAIEEQLLEIVPRPIVRPALGLWSGYRRPTSVQPEIGHSHFDTDLLVLSQVAGPALPITATLAATRALRQTVMAHSGEQPAPTWVSGHDADGSPAQNAPGHLACVALPFLGHHHADGRLLGAALIFPRVVGPRERGGVLGPMLIDSSTLQPRDVELKLGRLGIWTLRKCDATERRGNLQPETWTAFPNGAERWASVTPVVLDRFPKCDRTQDRHGWAGEVASILRRSCHRVGLPEPVEVDVDTTSWHRGSVRAWAKRRPLRGHHGRQQPDAALGDGFPSFPLKGTNAPRPQVHVWIRFPRPVVGPVLLGTGRYLGYGLCRPLRVSKEVR